MKSDPVITTLGLTRNFGQTTAVDELTLEIYAGEVFGFLGHNGAGKTTTIRLLNGILTPDRGIIKVLDLSPQSDGPALRSRTGVLTETPSLDERLTGQQNLAFFADVYGLPLSEAGKRVSSLLDAFELADRGGEKVGGYSRGMKQRLALARALLPNPEILFLDEPTTSLDPVASRQVHQLIRHVSRKEGRTVFLCTHNLAEAQALCDRVGVMENGRLLALGTPLELARKLNRHLRLELEVEPADMTATTATLLAREIRFDTPSEDGLFVLTGTDRSSVPEILKALVHAGVHIYQVTQHEPTLADAYFALHGQ